MKETILNKIRDQFKQRNIIIVNRDDSAVAGSLEPFNSLEIQAWIKECDRSQQEIWELNKECQAFIQEEFIVFLIGDENYSKNQALDYFKFHKEWLQLFVQYGKYESTNKSLDLLMKVAHTIASHMHEEHILDIIIEAVVEAINEADTGFLFLYDEKIEKLLIESAVGFREQSYRKTRLEIGEGVSGRVFQEERSVMIHGAKRIEAAMADMTKENYKHYINSTFHRNFPDSMISVPLRVHYKTIGVLTIDSFKQGARFKHEDLALLEALADHVAVVITHAQLYKQEKEQREELQKTHLALRKEHETMQRTTDFHHRLTNIAAGGGGTMAIVDTLRKMVRAPFAIYDSLLKPYFIESGAEDKKLPEKFLTHTRVKKVMRTKKWQQIQLDNKERLVVIPIVGAESLLGFLCYWSDSIKYLEADIVLFEYGATVLALEWTKEEAIKEARDRIKGEFVEDVLAGKSNPTIENQAHNLGLNPNDYYAVLLCKIDQSAPAINQMPENVRRYKEEWRKRIEYLLGQQKISGIVIVTNTYVFALMSFPEKDQNHKARSRVKQLVSRMEEENTHVLMGIGRVHKNLHHLNKSFADAEKCIQLLESHPEKKVMSFVEVGVYRFFLQHSTEELELYLTDILGPLLRYDLEKNRDFMKTLLYYVKFDKELNLLTKKLNIHSNTLYYRISRIQEILDIHFDQPEEWFNIQLACQVYEYLNKLKEGK
ncbi:GAF domain-containing protein [Halobacillus salinarum]|uniref:GAF domain-containing protein n=1 Tax=Halobacillus salinarum TaxID=2932257 RepID=A0ABY4EHG6_9BACI|nr:GAF domain-containing protein [Halobacillus salinarum]UOQ43576.1 GAF domain-containing protein [Halobacillus salinarum]